MLLSSSYEVRYSLFAYAFSLKARQSQHLLAYLICCAPRPRGLYLCLDHDLVKLSLTHSSTVWGKWMYLGGLDKSSLVLTWLILSLAVRGWVDNLSRLFPGLQTVEGIASIACLVRLRRGRRLVRLEHYGNILHGARSMTSTSSNLPDLTISVVTETSSGLGVGSPEG